MLRAIFTASVAATILALSATVAFAQTDKAEIDQENNYSNFSPDTNKGTIVLRVDNKTGQMAILNANKNIKSNAEAEQIAKDGTFVALNNDKIATDQKSELDNTKVQTGWYVINYGFNYYPSYAWAGVWSQPYYGYAYNDCNYYYYPTSYYVGWNTGWYGYAGWNGYYPYTGYNYGYGYGYGYGGGYRGGYMYAQGPRGNYVYGYRGSNGGYGYGYGNRGGYRR